MTPARERRSRSWLPEIQIAAIEVSGAALGEIGLAIAPQRPLTPKLVFIEAL